MASRARGIQQLAFIRVAFAYLFVLKSFDLRLVVVGHLDYEANDIFWYLVVAFGADEELLALHQLAGLDEAVGRAIHLLVFSLIHIKF